MPPRLSGRGYRLGIPCPWYTPYPLQSLPHVRQARSVTRLLLPFWRTALWCSIQQCWATVCIDKPPQRQAGKSTPLPVPSPHMSQEVLNSANAAKGQTNGSPHFETMYLQSERTPWTKLCPKDTGEDTDNETFCILTFVQTAASGQPY